MKKVLVINASAKAVNSNSRKLTEVFVDHLKNIHLKATISFRELGNADVPHISEKWIAGAFKPEAARSDDEIEALKVSDTYIAELREADIVVLGSPMYNWSIPSSLKAYIDQILRFNETFKVDRANIQNPYIGLLTNKPLFLLLSRGELAYERGGYNEHMNFQDTYLKKVFTVLGFSDIHVIAVSGASLDRDTFKKAIDTAHQDIKDLIDRELA